MPFCMALTITTLNQGSNLISYILSFHKLGNLGPWLQTVIPLQTVQTDSDFTLNTRIVLIILSDVRNIKLSQNHGPENNGEQSPPHRTVLPEILYIKKKQRMWNCTQWHCYFDFYCQYV